MKVLVIDAEPRERRALRVTLERAKHEVFLAQLGEEGLDLAALLLPEVILLDPCMPDLNGYEICKQLRTWSKAPIIILSGKDLEEEKIKALDMGADDYVTKPFGMGELLARIRAVTRRANTNVKIEPVFEHGRLKIDFSRRTVIVNDEDVRLTPKEYNLLCFMSRNIDRILTHKLLLSEIWGPEYIDDTHTLFVHMANLRSKIETQPERERFIHTERRVGYRFVSVKY